MSSRSYVAPAQERVKGVASRPELCDALEQMRFFRQFERDDIRSLSEFVESFEVPAGETILTEGTRGPGILFIVSGQINLLKEDAMGISRGIGTVKAGSVLGEMSIVDNQPISATAIAGTATTVVVLSRDNMVKITRKRQRLAIKLLWQISGELSARLRKTTGTLVTRLD